MFEIKKIGVFCGSSVGTRPEYLAETQKLGKLLAARNISLVYGGAEIGLMGALANSMLEMEGDVIGVIPSFLVDKEIAHPDIDELHVVDSMHERKQKMYDLADAFVLLPGGVGSCDEFFEIFSWNKLALINKPLGILNINNYYDHIIKFIDHSITEGFLELKYRKFTVETSAQKLLEKMLDISIVRKTEAAF